MTKIVKAKLVAKHFIGGQMLEPDTVIDIPADQVSANMVHPETGEYLKGNLNAVPEVVDAAPAPAPEPEPEPAESDLHENIRNSAAKIIEEGDKSKLTPTGRAKKASIEEDLGVEISKSDYLVATTSS